MPKINRKALSQLKAQLRVRNQRDFALWKIQIQVSLVGIHHGTKADKDGILSALQWITQYLKNTQLTFIKEEKI